jgi:hypothetical protein
MKLKNAVAFPFVIFGILITVLPFALYKVASYRVKFPLISVGTLIIVLLFGLYAMVWIMPAGGQGSEVQIIPMKYLPNTLTVKAGATVTFKNDDAVPHTATSFSFDTEVIPIGHAKQVTFATPGIYNYFCEIHPTMHGTIVVLAPGSS